MKWRKLHHIFVPNGQLEWMKTHASNPFAQILSDGRWLIYFSPRDSLGRSHIGALLLNPRNNHKIESICPNPLLSPGQRGLFDDSGISMCCILDVKGEYYLYYLGWNLRITVPWQNSIGLAIAESLCSEEFPTFRKYSLAPIMDRSQEDPFSLSYSYVLREGPTSRMWYGSNLFWGEGYSDMSHVIKHAYSQDGIRWTKDGVVISHVHSNEYAIARPCIIKEEYIYKAWYSYRGREEIKTYRIGYAESEDGYHWIRKDEEVGIDISEEGWDSEMICYPHVFDYEGNRYMLYNGNSYGKTGFGLAILEQD